VTEYATIVADIHVKIYDLRAKIETIKITYKKELIKLGTLKLILDIREQIV